MQTLKQISLFSSFVLPAIFAFAGPESAPNYTIAPTSFALTNEAGEWIYRHFPSGLRLYVYDADPPGKSACNLGCASAWPPVLSKNENDKPVGDWTIISRDNGSRQWAYKGQPVYFRYHDTASEPKGDGVGGVWHFLEPLIE